MTNIRRLAIIVFGTFIMAFGLVVFYLPSNIAAGGVSGFSIVITYIFPFLNLGLTVLFLNVLLFIFGFIILGKEFGLLTLLGSVFYSLWISVLDYLIELDKPLVDDLLLNVIFGAILTGIGMAMIYNQNASSGGTDILAKIVNKYTNIDIGKSGLIVDIVIVAGTFVFIGIDIALYSLLGIVFVSLFIDEMIAGFKKKIEMTILSNKIPEINSYIIEKMDRSSTIYKGIGGYSQDNRPILKTIVDKRQYFQLKEFINEIDENAFVYVSNVNEVIGEGFTREKKKR